VAFSYTLVRGATRDPVVDAWIEASHTEIWLIVQATAPVATTIVSSLRA
jgi:hypothetical protein